jgi:hypothetical protein
MADDDEIAETVHGVEIPFSACNLSHYYHCLRRRYDADTSQPPTVILMLPKRTSDHNYSRTHFTFDACETRQREDLTSHRVMWVFDPEFRFYRQLKNILPTPRYF